MSRDKVRCPYCPRTMDREDYPMHWELLHKISPVTLERLEWREPLEPSARRPRQTTKINDDVPLWEDEG